VQSRLCRARLLSRNCATVNTKRLAFLAKGSVNIGMYNGTNYPCRCCNDYGRSCVWLTIYWNYSKDHPSYCVGNYSSKEAGPVAHGAVIRLADFRTRAAGRTVAIGENNDTPTAVAPPGGCRHLVLGLLAHSAWPMLLDDIAALLPSVPEAAIMAALAALVHAGAVEIAGTDGGAPAHYHLSWRRRRAPVSQEGRSRTFRPVEPDEPPPR
jgi:hypothetical protein